MLLIGNVCSCDVLHIFEKERSGNNLRHYINNNDTNIFIN